ncbi:MAG: GDP-mannose 4,6-dehydratase, partial [Anaerolineae bacterium]|nr:GDP-mannose 4,6-dehydratase [Anaerolineae bacterium]
DVENGAALERLAGECEVIIHLAAVVGVDRVLNEPVSTLAINLSGTEAALKAARRRGVKTLIASTSEVYGKGAHVPFREDDDVLLGPTSKCRWAYAASKMVDEFMGLAYHHEHGLPVVVFRLFNTVGPRQTGRYGMVLPRFVRAALHGEPLRVFGDGTQSRCFGHVRDAVRAIIALADAPQAVGRVFNIGTTEEISISGLAQRVIDLTDSVSEIELVPYAQAYPDGYEDMPRRVPDTSRIRETVGWEPHLSLDEIISDVAESLRQ